MKDVNYDATFTSASAMILLGIIGAAIAALVCLVILARWLMRQGDLRIGLALMDSTRPKALDVARLEAELLGEVLDLGRTRSRTLAEKLSIARNEIAA